MVSCYRSRYVPSVQYTKYRMYNALHEPNIVFFSAPSQFLMVHLLIELVVL
jgi:hypothetical protein